MLEKNVIQFIRGLPACLVFLFPAASLLPAAPVAEPSWAVRPSVPSAEQLFPPGAVQLLDGPFKTLQDADLAYLIRLEPDRLLAQFRVEAGLEPKAKPYGGWESPAQPGKTWSLAGHSLGHYLSALSRMYRLTGDEQLKTRITYISLELKECQDKRGDGSLAAFPYERELEADIRAGKVESIDKYWAPFYTIHKDLAGLRDAWLWCDDATAREVFLRLADWCGSLVKDLPDERRERLLQMEHGGMAEVLADAYAITGDRRYLDYARLYEHHAVMDPMAEGKDILTGLHANTQIPKFIGYQRIHELAGDAPAGAAARFFWQAVVSNRSWVNGGNSTHEHFPDAKDMASLIPDDGGPETCNTYNMLKLTEELYRERPASAYVDYYEDALFNHILPSEAPLVGAGAFVYYTPLRPDFARSYGTPFNSFWCCTGTGMENPGRYPDFIYAHTANTLTVNLFMASALIWPERGVELRQETRFPDEEHSALVFTAAPKEALTLCIRHPSWLAIDHMQVSVNGHRVKVAAPSGGYAQLTRRWQAGDRVDIELPMKVRVVREPQTPGWVSFFYGPILLVGQLGADNTTQGDYIGTYTPIKAMRPLEKAPVVVGNDRDMVAEISRVAGETCAFKTTGFVKPENVTLAPFFRTHFQRYAMYWQVMSPQSWKSNQWAMAEAERANRELEGRTVDEVRIGEQQPEIDHSLRFEHSQSGIGSLNRRWRDADEHGWFSYDLKLPPAGTPAGLYVTYWGGDGGRNFDILVDDHLLLTETLRGGRDAYFSAEYALPAAMIAGKKQVTVRFQSKPGSRAGGVFGIRIVKTQPGAAKARRSDSKLSAD